MSNIYNNEQEIRKKYPLISQLYDEIDNNENLILGYLTEETDLDENLYGAIIFKYFDEIGDVRQYENENQFDINGYKTNSLKDVIEILEKDLQQEVKKCQEARERNNNNLEER